jgi:hypothetical protein
MLSSKHLPLEHLGTVGETVGMLVKPLAAQSSRHLAVSEHGILVLSHSYSLVLRLAVAVFGLPSHILVTKYSHALPIHPGQWNTIPHHIREVHPGVQSCPSQHSSSVHAHLPEVCSVQMRIAEVGLLQMRLGKVSLIQVGKSQDGPFQVCLGKVGSFQVR